MRPLLLAWLVCLTACGDDDTSEPQPQPQDAGDAGELPDAAPDAAPDATLDEVPPVADRDEPACEALGRVASASRSFHATTNFFAGCDGTSTERLPDAAFTWTAPEAGLYRVGLSSSEPWDTRVALGIRRGECVLTEREGAVGPPEGELSCDSLALTTENGENDPYQILAVDEGETLTILAEGDDYFLYPDPAEVRRQTFALTVDRVQCPGVRARDGADRAIVEELPSAFPVDLAISSSASDPMIRPLSCGSPVNDRQYPVAWTAPESGRYTFTAEVEHGDSIAIAALRDSCTGEELACEQGERATSISLELAAGEKVILFVEITSFSDNDHHVVLSVSSATVTTEPGR